MTGDELKQNGTSTEQPQGTDTADEAANLSGTEEFIERERIKTILGARERCRERRLNARVDVKRTRGYNETDALVDVHRATKEYIRELEYPLRHSDVGSRYWNSITFATWEIDPPEPHVLAWKHRRRNNIGGPTHNPNRHEMPHEYELLNEAAREPIEIELTGLRDYINTPPQYTAEHTAKFYVRHRGNHTITESSTHMMPERYATHAFRLCNQFAGEIGLDLEATKDDSEAESEYADLL